VAPIVERRLYFCEYVNRSAAEVVKTVLNRPESLFENATRAALGAVATFHSRLHVEVGGFDISRPIEISLGSPHDEIGNELDLTDARPFEAGYSVYFPIKWHAEHQVGLFPAMDAELLIVELGGEPPVSQVGISGFYRPPLGTLGRVGDDLLMHRVAEAGVRHFVTDLAQRLG
jgi:hypothetical protein